ncbi:MAG TPA: hypothetical protein VJB90_01115 [Candidatus Nanoarchaeia archaeon]|nr:hypothetical protein [Candidatus Nanoarchaeia archaeon]
MPRFNWNELTWDDINRDKVMERIAGRDIPQDIQNATMQEVMRADYNSDLYQVRFLADILGKQIKAKKTLGFWERTTKF